MIYSKTLKHHSMTCTANIVQHLHVQNITKKIEIVALNEHRDDVLMIYNGNRNTALMDFTNLKFDVKFVPNLFGSIFLLGELHNIILK